MPITRRFAWSLALALALLLHAMALYFLRLPASPSVAGRKAALEVVLLAAEAPPSADFREVRRGASITGMLAPPRRAEPPTVSGEADTPAPPPQEPQVATNATQLRESARRIIREEAKNTDWGTTKESGNPVDDTVEAKLARALRAPSAGEKRLDRGVVKITTVFGTTYCLETPPDRMNDGPVAPISVPTTCP